MNVHSHQCIIKRYVTNTICERLYSSQVLAELWHIFVELGLEVCVSLVVGGSRVHLTAVSVVVVVSEGGAGLAQEVVVAAELLNVSVLMQKKRKGSRWSQYMQREDIWSNLDFHFVLLWRCLVLEIHLQLLVVVELSLVIDPEYGMKSKYVFDSPNE